jgi:dihydroorotate dehydrogenase
MIKLSNDITFRNMVPSGALAYDGLGWLHERPLVACRLIDPRLFVVVTKSLSLNPIRGNLSWWHPWTCVRHIPNRGTVNRVGLTNPGMPWWRDTVGPKLAKRGIRIVVSLYGTPEENAEMVRMTRHLPIVGYEVNDSCPNTGHSLSKAELTIANVRRVYGETDLPIGVKVSADQDYLAIADGLRGIVQWIALNSVPWAKVFPDKRSPLWKLERKLGGGGGGGVSGRPAQRDNWEAVRQLVEAGHGNVVAPSIMEHADLPKVDALGAAARSYGTIHLYDPTDPTRIVRREMNGKGQKNPNNTF